MIEESKFVKGQQFIDSQIQWFIDSLRMRRRGDTDHFFFTQHEKYINGIYYYEYYNKITNIQREYSELIKEFFKTKG